MSHEIPHNAASEAAVLGGVLLRASKLREVRALLSVDDFYLPANRTVFEAMCAIDDAGAPIDAITVVDRLLSRSELAKLPDGEAYVASLAGAVPTAETIGHHAHAVKAKSTLRKAIAACVEIRGLVTDGSDPAEVVSEARRLFADLEVSGEGGPVRLGDKLGGVLEQIGNKSSTPDGYGVPTGISAYDRIIGPFRSGQLVVIAARPGIGKTALAGGIALRAAKRGVPSLVFSLEMSFQELGERFLGAEERFPIDKIGMGAVSRPDIARLYSAADRLRTVPLYIDDRVLTAPQIWAQARSWRARQRTKHALVVIDYLGLIRSSGKAENRNLEVGRMAWGAKALAKDLDCPVLLVSQLNRAPEKDDREPVLSDLRDSGEIEQHANTVIFPHRSKPLEDSGPAVLLVAKNRGGKTGRVECWWHAEYATFEGAQGET